MTEEKLVEARDALDENYNAVWFEYEEREDVLQAGENADSGYLQEHGKMPGDVDDGLS